MIEFKAKFLGALLPFRALNDPRFYLGGIHVEPHPQGGALLVATNGHMMMCAYDATAICTAPALLTVAGDAARFCSSAKDVDRDSAVHVNPITERLIITSGFDGRELFVQPGKCIMPTGSHSFPDWRRVIPKLDDLTPGFADSIQAAYLEQVGRAHPLRRSTKRHLQPSIRAWQVKATEIIAIEFNGAPEYMLLIMPISHTIPNRSMRDVWADACVRHATAEAAEVAKIDCNSSTEANQAITTSSNNQKNEETKMSNSNLFVTVPAITLPNSVTVPSFQVGQYLCAKGEDGTAVVSATAAPWVRINYAEAGQACAAIGGKLITELQYLAIAHDIAAQDINWTGGKVGVGGVFQGLNEGNVDAAQPGDFASDDESERRWHQLSNGEKVFDFAGNAYSWTFDDVQGDESGLVAKAFTEDSPSIATAPFPSMENGMGWRPDAGSNWSGDALVRGGCWNDEDYAGVFRLGGDWPVYRYGVVGFRCTK
ncbi:MAG: hypothetical protein WA191_05210 [Telluria sp.]